MKDNISTEDFFKTTKPTELIKEIIAIIDKEMKGLTANNKSAATILSAENSTGKTHALTAAYNLFSDFKVSKDWLDQHDIRFNKFNIVNIKASNSCLLSLSEEVETEIWPIIFNKADKIDLLAKASEIPKVDLLQKLAKRDYLVLFMDDFALFFNRLRKEKRFELLKRNRIFIKNLLKAATANEKIIIFISDLAREEAEFLAKAELDFKKLACENKIKPKEAKKDYKTTTELLRDTIALITEKEAKKTLASLIRDNLFSQDYKIYGYEEIKDKNILQYILLFDKLDAKDIFKNFKDKEKIVILKAKKNLLQAKYLNKIKTVIAIKQIKNEMAWDDRQIDLVLKRQKEELLTTAKDLFGSYIYWQRDKKGELKFKTEEFIK